jgi:anaerobic selenocysteine-containing dehydrogenase
MNQSNTLRSVYRTCPLCEATCGLEIILKDGRVEQIRGDKEDVLSAGFFCAKGAALGELHDDPNRLRRPLARHAGRLKEVSWEEAFDLAEKGLTPVINKYGRDAVALFFGNPCAHTLSGQLYLRPLLNAFKSRNLYSASTTDQMPRHVASGLMFGAPGLITVPDLDRTHYLLILGANPFVSGGSMCTAPGWPRRLQAIRERGGKVVVVDPVKTKTAQAADEHHFIRPGTDPWFLLGIIHTLFAENLLSLGRAQGHVNGLEELRALVEPFGPEAAARVCGIAAPEIRRLAREIAAAPAGAVYGRIGTNTVAFGSLNAWLIDMANILTGNLDRPGGVMFAQPGHAGNFTGPGGKGWRPGRWQSRVKRLPEVMGEFPAATLADEIETPGEGQVRALVVIAGNPVVSAPDARRLDKALAALDFMVSVDFYLNETSRHAHVILPPPGPLNVTHSDIMLYANAVRNVAHFSKAVLPPDFGHPDKWEILLKLALIAGGQGSKADPAALDDFIISTAVSGAVKDERSPVHGRDPGELLKELSPRKGPDRMLDSRLIPTGLISGRCSPRCPRRSAHLPARLNLSRWFLPPTWRACKRFPKVPPEGMS